MTLWRRIQFRLRWWRWFLGGPNPIRFHLEAQRLGMPASQASENYRIAKDRWFAQEPNP